MHWHELFFNLFMILRYSSSTIDALEMMDDDKIDLDLIATLIRYIALEEEVSFSLFSRYYSPFHLPVTMGAFQP